MSERKDCVVQVNCVEVKAVPVGLRGKINPMHKLLLEIIEQEGKDGKISIRDMVAALNKRQSEDKLNG